MAEFKEKVFDWVLEDLYNTKQIRKRAVLVSLIPVISVIVLGIIISVVIIMNI